jgi:hypothetical protein
LCTKKRWGGGLKPPPHLPRITPISVKQPHVLRRGEGWMKYGAGAREFTKITYNLTREVWRGATPPPPPPPPPPPTNHRTTCKDKIKVWARLTKKHILQSIITTDSHILGGADGTQTWSNVESCAKMFAEMSKRLHNVREKLIEICAHKK